MRKTCREEILAAFHRLEQRHGRNDFELEDILKEVRSATDQFKESTIRTQISAVMCVQAPVNHGTTYPDLDRISHGRYQRR